jgi:SnoaL-like domain
MDPSDELEIIRVLNTYAYLVDDGEWDRLDDVFTKDAEQDGTAIGIGVWSGLDAISTGFQGRNHPIAHHMTNIVVSADGDEARARTKFLTVPAPDSVRTGEYVDNLRRTPAGWRIYRRAITRRAAREG